MNILNNLLLTCPGLSAPWFLQAQNCNTTTALTLTHPGTAQWAAPAAGGPFSVRITATGAGESANNLGSVTVACLQTLPVQLTNSQAVLYGNKGVQPIWETATEKDTRGFEAERSIDGRNRTPIGFIPGNGDFHAPVNYSYHAPFPLRGVNYHRLKQHALITFPKETYTARLEIPDGAIHFRKIHLQ